MAGRGTDIKLKEGVKEAGGLAIIGTERHESRRVDRQLRGRAGRQGDPGSSQFFVSLEDQLMRLFGSERIASMMDRLGHKEGDMIQHSMITKSIERAQKKVEENHFGVRKRLLEYDDVMNSQREVIYKKRRHALYEDRLSTDISDALYDTIESICAEYQEERDFEGFSLELIRTLSMESPISAETFNKTSLVDLTDQLFSVAYKHYEAKKELLATQAFPVIKNVFETQGAAYENIVIPLSDSMKQLNIVAHLKKCYESGGKYMNTSLEKSVTLAFIDEAWKEHLRELDDLKQNIQGGAFLEQKDPLVTYKLESYKLFKKMIDGVNREIITFLFKASLPTGAPAEIKQAPQIRSNYQNIQTTRSAVSEHAETQEAVRNQRQGERPKPQPVVAEDRVGRNDPCPCGSGKKYKQCHGTGE
jgi:preprotein translocase subunit SecA